MWNQDIYLPTLLFAAKAHKNQKVPGSEMNYVTHIANVSMEVAAALVQSPNSGIDATFAVQCALLHDCIEDTPISYEDIKTAFGLAVADGVLALTKDFSLPTKSAQMVDSLQRIVAAGAAVRLVKMADRVNNLQSPPAHWSLDKKKKYLKEAALILAELQGVNPYIEQRLAEKIKAYALFCGGGELLHLSQSFNHINGYLIKIIDS